MTQGLLFLDDHALIAEVLDQLIKAGDVNSTMACAVTAKKLGVKVAHVEAGLRSRDMGMPEEINRLCTDAVSDYLYTTDEGAGENLRAENVAGEIVFVGNTMVDSLQRHRFRAAKLDLRKRWGLEKLARSSTPGIARQTLRTTSRSARPIVALARKPGPMQPAPHSSPISGRIGPLTTTV